MQDVWIIGLGSQNCATSLFSSACNFCRFSKTSPKTEDAPTSSSGVGDGIQGHEAFKQRTSLPLALLRRKKNVNSNNGTMNPLFRHGMAPAPFSQASNMSWIHSPAYGRGRFLAAASRPEWLSRGGDRREANARSRFLVDKSSAATLSIVGSYRFLKLPLKITLRSFPRLPRCKHFWQRWEARLVAQPRGRQGVREVAPPRLIKKIQAGTSPKPSADTCSARFRRSARTEPGRAWQKRNVRHGERRERRGEERRGEERRGEERRGEERRGEERRGEERRGEERRGEERRGEERRGEERRGEERRGEERRGEERRGEERRGEERRGEERRGEERRGEERRGEERRGEERRGEERRGEERRGEERRGEERRGEERRGEERRGEERRGEERRGEERRGEERRGEERRGEERRGEERRGEERRGEERRGEERRGEERRGEERRGEERRGEADSHVHTRGTPEPSCC